MITRGVVEKSIDDYRVKVRLPSIDRVASSSIHTSTDDLNTAIFATVPGCEVHLQPGDVVIVSIEDDDQSAVILGYLYRLESIEKHCSYNMDSLIVKSKTQLPRNTTIGDIKSSEISHLKGLNANLQKQLDDINHRLTLLEEK